VADADTELQPGISRIRAGYEGHGLSWDHDGLPNLLALLVFAGGTSKLARVKNLDSKFQHLKGHKTPNTSNGKWVTHMFNRAKPTR